MADNKYIGIDRDTQLIRMYLPLKDKNLFCHASTLLEISLMKSSKKILFCLPQNTGQPKYIIGNSPCLILVSFFKFKWRKSMGLSHEDKTDF